jgi:tetratricopeptide (TPR) repeat protein
MAILLGAGGTWLALPFEDAPVLAAVVGILGLGLAVHWWLTQTKRLRIVGTHLVACAAIALLAQVTDTAHKYYLSLGYASHRFGERQAAVHGFTRATEVAPDDEVANRYLAGLIMDDDPQRALQLFRKGQQIAPDEFRNYLGEAMLYHRMSRGEEAYRAAKEAESRAPGNKDALAIMSYWRAQLPNMP